jgi:hypothetical protein
MLKAAVVGGDFFRGAGGEQKLVIIAADFDDGCSVVIMNAIGIDVSKGISTVAVVKPFGEIVKMPFDVPHTSDKLSELAAFIRSLDGESRIVMENTGRYHEPIANVLCAAGLFVSVINAKLAHDYGGDTIRKAKTDKIDSLKIANYCLDKWVKLEKYSPEAELRKTLKVYNRQYSEYSKLKTMLKNSLISLLDQTFPGANVLFSSPAREKDGHEKWIDFVGAFYHCDCVSGLAGAAFAKRYEKWCRKNGYQFSMSKADEIYAFALNLSPTLPENDFTKNLVILAVDHLYHRTSPSSSPLIILPLLSRFRRRPTIHTKALFKKLLANSEQLC